MTRPAVQIAENVAEVQQRIAEAAVRVGRRADEVTMVAVTKYVGLEEARWLVDAGYRVLGESRPQQLFDKADALEELPIDWHMIGHLQRNKIRRTLPLISLVQSADNMRLIEAVDRIAGELSLRVPILLQVNISGEQAKHGFGPDEVEPLLEEMAGLGSISIRGMMCMAGRGGSLDAAREAFARLRTLRDRLVLNCPDQISLEELSMGMSGDYEVAIGEGATIVRVGSALFQGVL